MMDVEISDVYSNEPNKELLMAIKSYKFMSIVKLLNAGVDVNCLDMYEKMAPIHFTVKYAHKCLGKDMLNIFLEHPKTDINISDGDGNSALHLATIAGNIEFVKLLLDSKGIKPNQLNRDGMPPAYLSTLHGAVNGREVLGVFLRSSDVDFEMTIHNKKLKEVINEKYPGLMPFKYLYAYDEVGFISQIPSLNRNAGDDGQFTYLQCACVYGLKNVVKELLKHGFDPNGLSSNPNLVYDIHRKDGSKMLYRYKPYPLFMAALYGYSEIIQLFTHTKRLKIIFQESHDRLNNTSALHLVIEGSIEKFLAHNPGLCDYDKSFNILLPICSSLDVDFADSGGNTCLHSAANVKNQNYIYQLLNHGASLENRNEFGVSPLEDIDVDTMRSYLDKCINLHEWRAVKNYEIKFSYEFLYSSSYKTENISETNLLTFICEFPEYRSLLQHPVLTTIINSKWHKIKRFYFMNLMFYITFLSFTTSYILFSHIESLKNYLMFMVLACLMIFILRELFQFAESPKKYLSKYENLLDICVIIVSSNLIWKHFSTSSNDVIVSLLVIIVFWSELVFILGKHSRFAVPFAMFKLVSETFLKFLLCYSILIIAFILIFYEIFKDNNKVELDNFFSWSFKTIIMLTGEFDSSNLPFSTYDIVGRLVFLLFVFLIPIVLVNLLNGLAVSDTQKIQNDAEIILIMARLHFIHSFETLSISSSVQNMSRRLNSLLGTRFFDLNCNLFADRKHQKLSIYPYKDRKIHKDKCKVNWPGYIVYFDIIKEVIKKIKSVPDNPPKNNEIDVNILIEENKEIKQILNSIKQKIDNLS